MKIEDCKVGMRVVGQSTGQAYEITAVGRTKCLVIDEYDTEYVMHPSLYDPIRKFKRGDEVRRDWLAPHLPTCFVLGYTGDGRVEYVCEPHGNNTHPYVCQFREEGFTKVEPAP